MHQDMRAVSPTLLTLDGVAYSYGDVSALNGVDISLPVHGLTLLLGRNGAGKSTLMDVIAGLKPPAAGAVKWQAQVDRAIGYAPQGPGLYTPLSVASNLAYFARINGVPSSEVPAAVEITADRCGIAHVLGRRVFALSYGQRQLVHVGCALVHDPAVVLLDEPSAGVDAEARERLTSLVTWLAEQAGRSVVYSTHYLSEVEQLEGAIVVLDHGRVARKDRVERLAQAPGASTIRGRSPTRLDIPGATWDGDAFQIQAPDAAATLGVALAAAERAGVHISRLHVAPPTLEELFADGVSTAPDAPR